MSRATSGQTGSRDKRPRNSDPNTAMSPAHLKLKISERFRKAKEEWHADPTRHGTMEIPLPPPQIVNAGQGEECRGTYGRTDSIRPLAFRGVSENGPETHR